MLKHLLSAPETPKRVVVIGGSGFIGKELIEQLKAAKVEAISIASKDVDLTSPESVSLLKQMIQKEDSVVFTSALTPDKGKDARTLMKNLTMAQNLATFIEQSSFAHFVHISSDAVYNGSEYLIRETTAISPGDLYGYMHVGREMIVTEALKKAKIPYAVLRPCTVYGQGDTHNSYGPNRFCRNALSEGKITLFGEGEEKRDHISVKDVGALIVQCLSHRSEGTLNVATGNAVSFYEVAQTVVSLSSSKVEIKCNPRATPITHRHFDTTATVKAFPSFRFTALDQGLSEQVRKNT